MEEICCYVTLSMPSEIRNFFCRYEYPPVTNFEHFRIPAACLLESLRPSVHPSICMKQLENHWNGFHEFWNLRVLICFIHVFLVFGLSRSKLTDTLHQNTHVFGATVLLSEVSGTSITHIVGTLNCIRRSCRFPDNSTKVRVMPHTW
jgi:hypothetical protein